MMLQRLILCMLLVGFFCPHNAAFATKPAVPAAPSGSVSIVDDSQNTVTLPAPALRIIPLYAALGETLVAMRLDGRIIARTAAENAQFTSPALPSIGTHMRPNLEIIAALKPDLVIQMEGREESAAFAESLKQLGIPVARFRVTDFDSLFACVTRLGVLTGQPDAAVRLITEQKNRLAVVANRMSALPKPSIFFEIRFPNLLGAGAGNMVSAIITAAGGRNALAAYPDKMVRLNEEMLPALNPDIYIMQEGAMNKKPLAPAKRPHFQPLRAITSDHVYTVDEDIFSRPSPRSIDAVEKLAGIILIWNNAAPAASLQKP